MASLLALGLFVMQPVLLWFRRNLRLSDNAALIAAADSGRPIIPLYVVDEQELGGASRWWLQHSLASLDRDLYRLGASLVIRSGSPQQVLAEMCAQSGAQALYYSRRYEPASRRQEDDVHDSLDGQINIRAFDDGLLHHPDSVMTHNGTPYRVFTPFWKAAASAGEPGPPLPVPSSISFASQTLESRPLANLDLSPVTPDREIGRAHV